ncbi:MAG: cadherin repeat domain-containing protein, partial [Methanosarcinales archaeon]|nr:cadherin repeat domain-containing protein [Methanosarcinales archaeon]
MITVAAQYNISGYVFDNNGVGLQGYDNTNYLIINITGKDKTAPIWDPTPTDKIVDLGVSFSYDVNATDSKTITYGINDTVNFKIKSSTGLIENNAILSLGVYVLNITATDSSSNVNWSVISITVQDDTAPIWDPTPTDQNVDLGVSFSYDVTATDSKSITYGINDTDNFKINPSTGLIENTTILSLGVYGLNITATDSSSNENWSIISVTVQDDTAPIWNPTPTDQNVDLGVSFSYDVHATDSQTITYGIDDTYNFSINPSTGLITNTTILALGVYGLNITATDLSSNVNWRIISVTVQDDTEPIWNPTPTDQNVDLGVSFSYDVTATDSQTITYGIDNTDNFSINPSTGLITNNAILALGVYFLNITAMDSSSNVNWSIISVTVQDNTGPIWDPIPTDQNIDLGVSFSYNVTAIDSQTITYGINNTVNFKINPSTGLITNNAILALGVYFLNITAMDSSSNVNWCIISVTVQNDTAPIWNPIPTDQNVDLGVSFSYDVTATDSQTITYGINDIVNFSINTSTGLIENTTILALGVYGLNITATDSSSNVNWRIISVTVQRTSDGSDGSGGSSGGGGGGGGTSGEAFENIVCTETDRQFVGK